ncbi:hypothetical protein AVEN_139914-1 [Araneus ventricosus]|uniref:Uncharacterized protein n=1 Tax=Araneus ventricosus TaxID=182803 RepID=A0A4Y2IGV3_ARAVE|nr:hypothetical protein AVEN_139914-1 [Araneus ventricosus]
MPVCSGGLARLPACPMASGPLKRRQFGPPRKCGREAKKNSFSQTHKQNSPFPQGPCFGVRHPFLGIYCRRNSTSQTAGGRISARRNQGPDRNGVLSTSFELRSFTDVSPANLRGIETGYLFCENSSRKTY